MTLEGGDPAELARRYAAEGASRLHLIDLDGAFAGASSLDLLERVATAGGLPLQVGGGYRSLAAIGSALAAGADRVMIGTAALDEAFLEERCPPIRRALVVAIDVRDGRVTTDGWTRSSGTTAAQLASRCAAARVGRLLVTSAARDGSLAGPDVALLGDVLPAGIPVLAAGGIASIGDLIALRDLGCEGAVTGSALLAGRFTLPDALAALTSG